MGNPKSRFQGEKRPSAKVHSTRETSCFLLKCLCASAEVLDFPAGRLDSSAVCLDSSAGNMDFYDEIMDLFCWTLGFPKSEEIPRAKVLFPTRPPTSVRPPPFSSHFCRWFCRAPDFRKSRFFRDLQDIFQILPVFPRFPSLFPDFQVFPKSVFSDNFVVSSRRNDKPLKTMT